MDAADGFGAVQIGDRPRRAQDAMIAARGQPHGLSRLIDQRLAWPVGFGDDAVVAGGLWSRTDAGPGFVADAVADPLTGMAAAVQAADLLTGDRAAVVDVPLAGVAAQVDSGACDARVDRTEDGWAVWTGSGPLEVAPPRSRPVTGRAAVLDAHGPALRDEFA